MKNILLVFSIVLSNSFNAQTFTGSSGPILDNQTLDIPITVSGIGIIDTASFGLETVCINANHTYNSDVSFWIVAPDGTVAPLFANIGGGDDDFINTCLNQDAATDIASATAPFTGTFRPAGQMGLVNNGQNANGTWYLRVNDNYGADEGFVNSFTFTFGNNPATYFSFSSSLLPIVQINTNGNTIADEPKIMADMKITYNGQGVRNYMTDPANHYNGKIGIEYRGSSSQWIYPKKSYGFETWNVSGMSIDTALLNMPSDNDWVLISAYSDKSQIRNNLTYSIWERMGYYAPRGLAVDLVIDGVYQGMYYFAEKIKRDNNRVDIAKLQVNDTIGDDVTGGYILKVDKLTGSSQNYWPSLYPAPNNPTTPVNIVVHYPNEENIVPQQLNYIHSFIDSFEMALYGSNFQDYATGWRKYADEESFIDYFLLTELSKNLDAYRSSCFFYKDKNSNGGKLKMGPVWDYDLAYGNADFCDTWMTTGWAYNFNYVCSGDSWLVPFWWEKLMQDTFFVNNLHCKWEELRADILSINSVNNHIDSVANLLYESQGFNYTVWPIIGVDVWPNYYVGTSYQEEVDTLKWWISERIDFIDNNLTGSVTNCNLSLSKLPSSIFDYSVYPNPFNSTLHITSNKILENELIEIYSLEGKLIYSKEFSGNKHSLDLSDLSKGVFYIKVASSSAQQIIKVE